MPTRILDVDIAHPLPDGWDAPGYEEALVLVRWHGRVLSTLRLPCVDGRVRGADVRAAVADDRATAERLTGHALRGWLLGGTAGPAWEALPAGAPSWSVIVCTRDRPDDLRRCLDSLLALDAPPGEIVVVDNAPSDDATARLLASYAARRDGHRVRYEREDRPGLNWARARGARVAGGEIVAYTDDDVVVDAGWVARLLEPFADPRVAAASGLAMPLELETEAQELFERYGGFSRGLRPQTFDVLTLAPAAAGRAGAGANMAFRRALVNEMALFDVEMDGGTVTHSGGDTYAFYRLLLDGYRIAYTPDALVWHRHRRDLASLRRTLYGYSVGGFAFLTRCLVQHRDAEAVGIALEWLVDDHVRLLARVLLRRRSALPAGLVLAYWRGVFVGPVAYFRSRRRERRLLASPPPTSRDTEAGEPTGPRALAPSKVTGR